MNKEDLATHIVGALNEFLACDPKAVKELMRCRVPCNEKLAAHPFVQVCRGADDEDVVGLLGILNSIVGTDGPKGIGKITAVYDDAGLLLCFKLTEDLVAERLIAATEAIRKGMKRYIGEPTQEKEVLIRKRHGTQVKAICLGDQWLWETTGEPVESDVMDWIRRTLEGSTNQKFLGMEVVQPEEKK